MVAAIGASSAAYGGSVATTPTAGLEAQLARYQKELSDCVNCDSAKTPEGKEQIQTISNKISAVRARIDEIDTAKPAVQPTASSRGTAIHAGTAKEPVLPDVENKTNAAPTAAPRAADSAVGSIVNVFA